MFQIFISGGPAMYPLLLCSMVALAIAIERALFWMREKSNNERKILKEIVGKICEGNFLQASALVSNLDSELGRRLLPFVKADNFVGILETLNVEANLVQQRARKNLQGLDTVVTVAPLLGILGTVTGIIQTFSVLNIGAITEMQNLSAGLSEALITTAAGLIIAIPAVVAFNYFSSLADKYVGEIDTFIDDIHLFAFDAAVKNAQASIREENAGFQLQRVM